MIDNATKAFMASQFRYSSQSNGHARRCGAALAIHHGAIKERDIRDAASDFAKRHDWG